jgi:hypothetical protein
MLNLVPFRNLQARNTCIAGAKRWGNNHHLALGQQSAEPDNRGLCGVDGRRSTLSWVFLRDRYGDGR